MTKGSSRLFSTSKATLARYSPLALLLAAGLIWCTQAALNVHSQAEEMNWLQANGHRVTAAATEMGLPRRDGSAEAVWIDVNGRPAFVDLSHSRQVVRGIGSPVYAIVDFREAPATATGVAADAVSRSFTRSYLARTAPGLLLIMLGLVGLASVALRRHHPGVTRSTRSSATHTG